MDSVIRGIYAEERFFQVARPSKLFPSWYFGSYPTDVLLDAYGIDAIAWIAREGTEQAILVPVQIKSSWTSVGRYYAKWPTHWLQRVVVCVVNEEIPNNGIRTLLTQELRHVRDRAYTYREFLAQLRTMTIDDDFLAWLDEQRREQTPLRKKIRSTLTRHSQ